MLKSVIFILSLSKVELIDLVVLGEIKKALPGHPSRVCLLMKSPIILWCSEIVSFTRLIHPIG
jgi:hypothetical protein